MAKRGESIGVVLMNLGGPDRPESVRPFLLELFNDPEVLKLPGGAPVRRVVAWLIATLRAPKVRKNYEEVGGSPLLPRTRAQERALEKRLNDLTARGGDAADVPRYCVRTAMRNWRPRTEEAVRELLASGVTKLIALPLYPQYSVATTASSVKELRRVLQARAPERPLAVIESYATDGRYLAALTRCVEEGLATAREQQPSVEPTLLFSAHGLPQRIVDSGDPYVPQIRATMDGVMSRLPGFRGEHLLAFQSRVGPVKWIGPSTNGEIARLAKAGCRSLVIVPVAFVSDHIETVHEIDLLFAAEARAAGISTFVRTPALDVRPDFIDALAHLVLHRLEHRSTELYSALAAQPDASAADSREVRTR